MKAKYKPSIFKLSRLLFMVAIAVVTTLTWNNFRHKNLILHKRVESLVMEMGYANSLLIHIRKELADTYAAVRDVVPRQKVCDSQ